MMRYLSVCSGIEAATVAWHGLGWKPAAFSDIDAFPRALLRHHYPDVPLHGDFTTIGEEDYGAIELLVGGTPCQDYSVAGLRAGLDGDRGNLTLEFARLAYRKRPEWLVWENVPGAFSTNGGRDFGAILATFSGRHGAVFEPPADGWRNAGIVEPADGESYGLAWRVLDAQFAGVPQRRRRIFIVGHIGDWRCAAAALFEREGLSGNPPPRRERGQVAPTVPSRSSAGGGLGTDFDCDGGLVSDWPAEVCPTLDTYYGDKCGLEDQHVFNQRGGKFVPGNPTAYQTSGNCGAWETGQITGALDTNTDPNSHILRQASAIRRLSPRECERLQGFPDDYTLIPYRGKPAADNPRYKALGNSMAVPVMRWIGERIAAVDALLKEKAKAA